MSWRRRAAALTIQRPIVTRLVYAVAAAMAVVLLASLGFVYWRVSFALDRQLDQDLRAYQDIVRRAVHAGTRPPQGTPGEVFQIYDTDGRVVTAGSAGQQRLVSRAVAQATATGPPQTLNVGHLLRPQGNAYRVLVQRMDSPSGPVVVAAAISRSHHDEALRELLIQLVLAGLLTLAAASLVGYGTARAALGPVERYRRAAAAHGQGASARLPVPVGRDDELTRLGRTLNELLDRIDATHERERQFLADASHELRTPLTHMRTELEFALLRDREAAELRAALVSLDGQVMRLVDLSNALLDLEELRAAQGLLRQRVDIPELLDRVTKRHRPALAVAGRDLRVHTDLDYATVSERWLDVAIDNLVGNAVKHGSGGVIVSACRAGPSTITVQVNDEGAGFPEDFAEHAFERFSRAQASRSIPGSGLGLALVEAVAEAHEGSCSIAGATVTLTINETGDLSA